jgi:hypothetical protein
MWKKPFLHIDRPQEKLKRSHHSIVTGFWWRLSVIPPLTSFVLGNLVPTPHSLPLPFLYSPHALSNRHMM